MSMASIGAMAVVLVLVAAAASSAATGPTTFRNPIAPLLPGTTPGFVALDSPDPWIFTFRGRYYLTNSAGDAHRSTSGVAELNLGTVKLPRGQLRFRFVLGSPGPATLDELRFAR